LDRISNVLPLSAEAWQARCADIEEVNWEVEHNEELKTFFCHLRVLFRKRFKKSFITVLYGITQRGVEGQFYDILPSVLGIRKNIIIYCTDQKLQHRVSGLENDISQK
jgi:hypothetical protein